MEHLSQKTIGDYRERKLAAAELLEVDEHLAHCDECLAACSQDRAKVNEVSNELLDDLLSEEPTYDEHLTYETFAALVDDEISSVDREIAQVHLDKCLQCAAELRSLEEFTAQPATPPFTPQQSTKFSAPSWFSWPRFAFAGVAALILATTAWITWKSQRPSVTQDDIPIARSTTPTPLNVGSPPAVSSPVASPEILVSLRDSSRTITLDSSGKIEGLAELPASLDLAIQIAITRQQLNIGPALTGLRGKTGTLMGSGTKGIPFRLVSPLGVVVKDDQPTFQWESYEGASVYIVKVYDAGFREIATSLSQTSTSWEIPISLPRGGVYTWQVTAIRDREEIKSPSAPAPQARFRVLGQDQMAQINRVRNIRPTSHLALGVLYAESGLLQDARREFQILLKANPESKLVQKFLQQVSGN